MTQNFSKKRFAPKNVLLVQKAMNRVNMGQPYTEDLKNPPAALKVPIAHPAPPVIL